MRRFSLPNPRKETLLKIGEVARRANVSPRAVRFYVQEGLLSKPVKTDRNMAYYDPGCVEEIKAIKRTQSERYLPLVVIRKMLELNGYDYGALLLQEPPGGSDPAAPRATAAARREGDVPAPVFRELSRRGWIRWTKPGPDRVFSSVESDMLAFLGHCQKKGIPWEDLIRSLDKIQEKLEGVVAVEYNDFIGKVAGDVPSEFARVVEWEARVIGSFVAGALERSRKGFLRRYSRSLDNAFLAIGDEGFGIPREDIDGSLREMERRLDKQNPDLEMLNDLATGYSCVGDLDKAAALLKRVLRRDPGNLSAQVRLCWYRRFLPRRGNSVRWRDRLSQLVQENPGYVMGHIFLSAWLASDSQETDDLSESLQLLNQSLAELEKADRVQAHNLHYWVVVQYSKGLAYVFLLGSLGQQMKGVDALEKVLKRRSEVEKYYANRMPFFPQWLWPNLYYVLGSGYLDGACFPEAQDALRTALGFAVSPFFKEKIHEGLRKAEEAMRRFQAEVEPRTRRTR
jgi:DNA-binding transcriptional MerR regulator